MKLYCSVCDKQQPVHIDNCVDAETNELYQDIACAKCGFVIASGTGIDTNHVSQEPVAIIEKETGFETEVYATGYADSLPDGVFKLYTTPQPDMNLNCKSVQKRLATSWGYVLPVKEVELTGQDLCDLEIETGWQGDSCEFDVIVKAVVSKLKEKNK